MTDTTTTEADTAIQAAETRLIAKYGDKVVPGSVHRATDPRYGNKLMVTINTRGLDGEYDGQTRTVATSDVFQVHHTDEVAAELRRARQAERRAARKAKDEPKAKEPKAKRSRTSRAKADKADPAAALGV